MEGRLLERQTALSQRRQQAQRALRLPRAHPCKDKRVVSDGIRPALDRRRPQQRLRLLRLPAARAGEHDSGQPPAMSWAIAGEIGEADVVIVPELQHLGLIERPDLFAEPVAEFLGRVLR